MTRNNTLLRKLVIGTFLSVPAISSAISMVHLVDLFNLGNPVWLSILLAITFELGSIASLLAISVIDRINSYAIWFIFFVLSALQIIGNVYYSYTFTSVQLLSNQNFLTTFNELFSFITGDDIKDAKLFLSCIIGIPIPLIALFFLKSNMDYLKLGKKNTGEKEQVKVEAEDSTVEESNEVVPNVEINDTTTDVVAQDENAAQDENTSEGEVHEESFSDGDSYGIDNPYDESDDNPQEPRRKKTRVIGNAKIKY